jgi:basic membrane lipoprotein Med (substrate-binding protein (PBP1-ABC) superfamily)
VSSPLARRAASALWIGLACAACGGGDESEAPAFRVALLTPGSIADGGWNAGAFAGLERIRDELGARVAHVETRSPAEFEENFRAYAESGYDLVFGHGFEYQDAAAKAAADFPETVFVTTSGNTQRPNLAPMVFELEQATWLCGFVAARMSASKRVGLVGGVDLPSIRSTFLAFEAGARAGEPAVEVREVFLGNFEDTGAAREAALALMEQGVDFVLHQANDAGRGVFQAVQERSRGGARVYAFGTNNDQKAMAPDVILASATLDLPGAFVAVARRVREGRFEAVPMRLGMAEGVVALVWNPALEERVPAELRAEVDALGARIRAGTLVVPRGEF